MVSQVDFFTLSLRSSSLRTVFPASFLISSHSFSPSSNTLSFLSTSITNSSLSSLSMSVTLSFSASKAKSLSLTRVNSPTSSYLKASLAPSCCFSNSCLKISLKTLISETGTLITSGNFWIAPPCPA